MEQHTLRVIARVHSEFPGKFGIPRQSGLVPELRARVVFEPEFRNVDALRGIEGFSHLWLIWQFSEAVRDTWSPTVRPPRLGGNARMGVFATRSPFRPNPIGLSCVKLEGLGQEEGLGTVLYISGADLLDGTPIYDIKPYIPYADAHPDARGGFAAAPAETIPVDCPEELLSLLPPQQAKALLGVLSQDPRPGYQDDPGRTYGMDFADWDVRFRVSDGVLTVLHITKKEEDA
ncbi:MAG: tRNA (N6-threonylcarbamoyladenosine(37)-N6)-methyltransferase TrmO [Oscillospiraceae bacterium]|nr:tRNA (N6-threonylcarbamoyladenosine(37)-N6)-methyltransferase TrmO [Oscillospiraceae bacterium]